MKSTEQKKLDYIRKSSPIRAFIMVWLKIKPDGYVVKQDLFVKFAEYCRVNKLPVVTADTFFKNLPQYVTVKTAKKKIEGKREWCFMGLTLRDKPREEGAEEEEEEDDDDQQSL